MAEKNDRPSRVHLFAFYYLGFNPAGEYRFANAHHVARWYNVSADAVLRWLEELELTSAWVLRQGYDLAEAQLDLQLDAPELTREQIFERVAEILAELDGAPIKEES